MAITVRADPSAQPGPDESLEALEIELLLEGLYRPLHELSYDSLEPFGVLALGRKESIHFSPFADRYEELDANERIYRRNWCHSVRR